MTHASRKSASEHGRTSSTHHVTEIFLSQVDIPSVLSNFAILEVPMCAASVTARDVFFFSQVDIAIADHTSRCFFCGEKSGHLRPQRHVFCPVVSFTTVYTKMFMVSKRPPKIIFNFESEITDACMNMTWVQSAEESATTLEKRCSQCFCFISYSSLR